MARLLHDALQSRVSSWTSSEVKARARAEKARSDLVGRPSPARDVKKRAHVVEVPRVLSPSLVRWIGSESHLMKTG